ncbi:MAG: FtsX-like permease family protein [Enterobacterales bacterium]|nr:FtsX-like permease family protein [Enterobacterales bacterium]
MNSFLSQSFAVIRMNLLSLPRRLWMSLAMIIASAVVVTILLAFLAMARGFEVTLKGAGSDDIAMFLRDGSAAELNSVLSKSQVDLIENAPGIAKDKTGVILSSELYVIVDGIKKTSQTAANIPLRGTSQTGIKMRQDFKLIKGRLFNTGTTEMIVGAGILRQFDGFELGKTIRFGKNKWQVVGVFSTGGNVFESELWSDYRVIQNLYNRGSSVQSIRAKLVEAGDIKQIKEYIKNDPRLNIDVETEADYFSAQGKSLNYMAIFGKVISSIMALGALAGALNTMYTSVADRSREIATLRTIGFSNSSAFVGTLFESLTLSALGGLLGALGAFLLFDGMSTSTLGGSFTQVVFSFELSQDLIVQGMKMALGIGLVSGFFPAWRAARMPVLTAFRTE